MQAGFMRRDKRVVIGIAVLGGSVSVASADSLFNYNVVVTQMLTDSSHIQGRTFVNNLSVNNQPDFAQSVAAGTGDVLDVAGTLSGSGLTLERGVFRHAGNLPSPFTLNKNGGSTEVKDSTVSITSLSNQMSSIAGYYNTLSGTTVNPSGGSINFNAAGAGLNVFNVSAANLSQSNEHVNVNTGSASAIIIKVSGSSFTFESSESTAITGSAQKVLWYFPSATTITLNDSQWNGSILAPLANLSSPSQQIAGGVYVANFTQNAQVQLSDPNLSAGQALFTGPVAAPVPASLFGGGVLFATIGMLRLLPRRSARS